MIDRNPTTPPQPPPGPATPSRLRRLVRSSPVRRPGWMRGPAIPDGVRRPTIVTSRLVLRPHRLRDASAWYRVQSDPEVLQYLAWPARSRAASFKHLLDRSHHTKLLRKDDFLALAVVHDGRLVGDVSLHFRIVEPADRQFEIGWITAPGEQGRGYAREAAEAMLGLAFDDLHARRVTARMHSGNLASKALAERLGFVEVAEVAGSRLLWLDVEDYRAKRDQRS